MSALRLSPSLSFVHFSHAVAILEIPTVEYATSDAIYGPNMYASRSSDVIRPFVGHALRHNRTKRPIIWLSQVPCLALILIQSLIQIQSQFQLTSRPTCCVGVGCREKYQAGPVTLALTTARLPTVPPLFTVLANHRVIKSQQNTHRSPTILTFSYSVAGARQPRPPCLLFLHLFLQRKAPSRRARSRRSPPSHPIPPLTRAIPPTRSTIHWFCIS